MFKLNKLNTYSIQELEVEIARANIAYYNYHKPIYDDNTYDYIIERLFELDPNNLILKKVGEKIDNKNKVKLPYYTGSLKKIKDEKDEDALRIWKNNNNVDEVVCSDKLDGFSCLVVYNKLGLPKIYTRGDGIEGMDISHLYSYLKLPIVKDIVVRGEIIIPREYIDECKILMRKKNENIPSRNLISCVVNAKTANVEIAKYVRFVAYEMLKPRYKPSVQFKELERLKFYIASWSISNGKLLTNKYLEELFLDRRVKSIYDIDGIVITDSRYNDINKDEKPKFSIAFKMNLDKKQTKIRYLEWKVTKDGVYTPVIWFDSIIIDGSVIKKVSGSNAKKVLDNEMGIGSLVEVIKAGSTIPHISNVISSTQNFNLPQKYEWDDNKVNICSVSNMDNEEIDIKVLINFFKKLKVKRVSEGTIRKLYNNGYTLFEQYLHMNPDNLQNIEGLGWKSANIICDNITLAINNCDVIDLMHASNCFGRGLGAKKLRPIVENILDYRTMSDDDLLNSIINIKGFQDRTAELFIDGLYKFEQFVKRDPVFVDIINTPLNVVNKQIPTSSSVHNGSVVFTGFRNKDATELIEGSGFKVAKTISGKTTHLIIKNKDYKNKKTEKANKKGIPIYTLYEFYEQVLNI